MLHLAAQQLCAGLLRCVGSTCGAWPCCSLFCPHLNRILTVPACLPLSC